MGGVQDVPLLTPLPPPPSPFTCSDSCMEAAKSSPSWTRLIMVSRTMLAGGKENKRARGEKRGSSAQGGGAASWVPHPPPAPLPRLRSSVIVLQPGLQSPADVADPAGEKGGGKGRSETGEKFYFCQLARACPLLVCVYVCRKSGTAKSRPKRLERMQRR